jgi:hypothetical protein
MLACLRACVLACLRACKRVEFHSLLSSCFVFLFLFFFFDFLIFLFEPPLTRKRKKKKKMGRVAIGVTSVLLLAVAAAVPLIAFALDDESIPAPALWIRRCSSASVGVAAFAGAMELIGMFGMIAVVRVAFFLLLFFVCVLCLWKGRKLPLTEQRL